jgi:hypothetical protein
LSVLLAKVLKRITNMYRKSRIQQGDGIDRPQSGTGRATLGA